jgi:aminoglycoside phosphotransferase family enzyme/predicted kinase
MNAQPLLQTLTGALPSPRDAGALLRDLMRPEAYPAPRPGGVDLRFTHASWVFLTEQEAWKVKRPVDLGFLDYSDAEKRRQCCEQELALGRRLAPDVYRGLADIHAGPGGHAFVGPGPVVDHAVRMRRLPDEDSAEMLLAEGRLTPEHLRRLAERLAAFFESTPRTPELGRPSVLLANIEENHAQTLPFAGRFLDPGLVERVHAWQVEAVARLQGSLLDRVSAGRIRDGHGDLRLEHVYFPDGRPEAPLVIDPIEFSRRFRCADAALDVAFLAMDLEAHHRGDLGAWFLSSFARATNDYDFYPLADLYLSYRAWVRAKVACLVAADPRSGPAKSARKIREANAFLALAASPLGPPASRGEVVAVAGVIGAGKSTLADALGMSLGFPVVSSDATRKHLAGLPADARGDAALYSDGHTRRTEDELLRRAGVVLQSGRGVILDATFRAPQLRARVRRLAEETGRPFRLVELTCDEALLRQRLRLRAQGPSQSDAGVELLDQIQRQYQPPEELPAPLRLRLDGSQPVEELVGRVRDSLAR